MEHAAVDVTRRRWLEGMLEAHPRRWFRGVGCIRYATQVKTRPPSFALFVSRPADLPDHYLRYLAAGLRDDFDMDGVPIAHAAQG